MPEGRLIPPRDPHAWDAEELIAPVIPFRQRGAQPEAPIADDREAEVAIVAAPADEPASNWIAEGSHLLAHDAIPQTLGENATHPPRRTRLLFAAAIALVLGVLAAAAVALDQAPQPHAAVTSRQRTAASTRRVPTVSSSHRTAASAATSAATRKPSAHVTTSSRKHSATTDRKRAATHRKHSTALPRAPTVTQSAAPVSAPAPATTTAHHVNAAGPVANPCAEAVPGQLGC
jgi:hypothetical protein